MGTILTILCIVKSSYASRGKTKEGREGRKEGQGEEVGEGEEGEKRKKEEERVDPSAGLRTNIRDYLGK